ncbi:TPA: recombinase family protein [Escherichia coli]|nr:recombinase family protein [Escherichia coli]
MVNHLLLFCEFNHRRKNFSLPLRNPLGFNRLLDYLESSDVLIVTKLNHLGRNAMNIRKTVEQLTESDIRVHYLTLVGRSSFSKKRKKSTYHN